MKAAVYRGKDDVRVEEVPRPEPEAGEMLVRVEACGVCGTDLKKIQKGFLAPPRIFGHEMAGVVERIGRGVTRFSPGDRVALHHHIPCGRCFYCARQAFAQCDFYKRNGTTAGFEPSGGGLAEYVLARDWIVERGTIAIPEGVLAEEATFIEPVNTCLKGVRHAGVSRGETVLVVGQGPIGLLLMQLCRWSGASVVTTDTMPDRREVSRSLGADVVFDARADVLAEVAGLTEGRGVDVAIVAAVGEAPFAQAVAATRPAGRILVFAATSPGELATVDLGPLTTAEKQILTSYSASVDVQDLSAQLVFKREIRVRELVTHRFSLERAPEALAFASRPAPGLLKVIVEMGRTQ